MAPHKADSSILTFTCYIQLQSEYSPVRDNVHTLLPQVDQIFPKMDVLVIALQHLPVGFND